MARVSFAALSLGAALATEETAASLRGSAAARRLGSALPAAGDVNTTAGARRLGTAYCIDAGSNGNPNTGDQIIVWECNGEAAQEWHQSVIPRPAPPKHFIKYGPDTTKCMTVTCDTRHSDCNGSPVTIEDCTESALYQQFVFSNGHIYVQGFTYVVDAGAWPLSNGLGLSTYEENGNPQQNWDYGDDYKHFYNSDSTAALAAEETTIALPASEDVNTTAGIAPSSSSLQGRLSETTYCNPYQQQMCPLGNLACPQCGSDRCECPSGPGPSPSPGCDGMYYTRNYAEGTEHECRCDNYCDNFCDDEPNGCARTCRILNGVFEHTPSVHAGDRTCAWQAHSVSNPVNYQGYDCSWMAGTGERGHGDNCQDFSSDGAWKCREGNQNQNNCRF